MAAFVKSDFSSRIDYTITDVPLYKGIQSLNKLFSQEQLSESEKDPVTFDNN
jgi:hypothetical protein